MSGITEPDTGLVFHELSHEWGHGAPTLPGYDDVKIFRPTTHAKNGVMAQRIRTVMHTGTHLNAPLHLVQKGEGAGQLALDKCFGPGVVVSLPKGAWELVTARDLEAAAPAIEAGDIVVIVTGWHARYSDSIEYFGHSPGLSAEAARWLVEKGVKLVGVDTPQVDHPLATSLGLHRNGPLMKRIPAAYEQATGRKARDDFPDWNIAHRTLLEAGVPTIENVGGDIGDLLGKRAVFHAYPWNWHEGDACPIRFIGLTDPGGKCRLEAGAEG